MSHAEPPAARLAAPVAELRRPLGGRIAPDTPARDPRSLALRRLTWGWALGLGLIATLLLGTGWALHDLLGRQAEQTSWINTAGYQRTLAERIVGLAAAAATHEEPGQSEELAEAVARFARARAALDRAALDGAGWSAAGWSGAGWGSAVWGGGGGRLELLAHAATAAPLLDAMLAAASQVLSLGPGPAAQRHAAALAVAEPELRSLLYTNVLLHERAARRELEALQRLNLLAVGAGLALLLAEALLLFRPLARRTADITAELEAEARTDALTGLMTRRPFLARLDASLHAGAPVALVAVDLDHFKAVNDAEGHAAGDALLRAAAERLRGGLRPGDFVARLGGDEFAAALVGVESAQDAAAAAARLRAAVDGPVPLSGTPGCAAIRLAATFGVALAPADATSPEALVRAADEALRAAKRRERGTVGRAGPEDARRAARAAQLALVLERARAAPLAGLSPHFQPVVRLRGGGAGVAEAEVLARLAHPELGVVPPDEMFAAAERVGVAHLLSRQVQREALFGFAALRRDGLAPGRIAVNLSAAELLREDVVDSVEAAADEAGIDLEGLTIEITEDALLDRVAHATLGRLAALRGRGVRLALDDFGTGTSGLAQLLRIPLDAVKLDRTFVQRLGTDGRAEKVVEGVVRLAQSLGLEVVAEGVEQQAQAASLRALGCDLAQGWLFARPMDLAAWRVWSMERMAEAAGVARLRAV